MRLFVTGADGQLGRSIGEELAGHDLVLAARSECNLEAYDSVRAAIIGCSPDVVIHAGAYTDVDGCERDPERAYRGNTLGTQYVATCAQAVGAELVAVSTDFVFDGQKGAPYLEYDETNPLSTYGQTKLWGERAALTFNTRCYVVRSSWIYSHHGRNFVKSIQRFAAERPELTVVADEIGAPTFAPDLARAIGALIETHAYGIYHLSNEGTCSRYEFARAVVERVGRGTAVVPITAEAYRQRYPQTARRPADARLANVAAAVLGIRLPRWEESLARYFATVPAPNG